MNCLQTRRTVSRHEELFPDTKNCFQTRRTVSRHEELFPDTKNCFLTQRNVSRPNVSRQRTVSSHEELFPDTKYRFQTRITVSRHKEMFPDQMFPDQMFPDTKKMFPDQMFPDSKLSFFHVKYCLQAKNCSRHRFSSFSRQVCPNKSLSLQNKIRNKSYDEMIIIIANYGI